MTDLQPARSESLPEQAMRILLYVLKDAFAILVALSLRFAALIQSGRGKTTDIASLWSLSSF